MRPNASLYNAAMGQLIIITAALTLNFRGFNFRDCSMFCFFEVSAYLL